MVCNKCNPEPGIVIPPQVIKKMYARFDVDCMAFHNRKNIVAEYMRSYLRQNHNTVQDQSFQ